jgi:two-component system OmpR family response regulator
MRILVVDDDNAARKISCLSLRRFGGIDVIEATCGTEAIARAVESQPDGVLLDVMMPGLDGPSTLAALRREPRTASIPVMFLTARAMSWEVAHLKGLGAVAVFTKPFDPVALPRQVRQALGHP